MSLRAGTRLGSFELLSSLGTGASGDVYRAKDLKLGREVAIKVLRPEMAGDGERLRRFEQEARAASALNHPNIVHIYEVGETDSMHYIAMELVDGSTLRRLLAEGAPFDEERVLHLGRQLADGLSKAHAAGIVHRDLKPENVMVTEDGFVKIVDFGLAKLSSRSLELSSDAATLARTRQGMLIGTVEYMSPEQASGKSVDHRSDQFSLGLILYEMATGKIAFHRDTAAQTLASIIETDPPPLSRVNPSVSGALGGVVHRCLAKDPARRYDDTRDLAKDLRSLPEALPPLPQLPRPRAEVGESVYHVDSDGKVRAISEVRLRRRLRQNRYSGIEMVRREGEEAWMPLHETSLFREEVPYHGAPADRAAKRKLMSFGQHVVTFAAFGVAMYVASGDIPFWMGFWGIGVAVQAFSTIPAAVTLLRSRKLALEARTAVPEIKQLPPAPPRTDDLLPEAFREEVSRVRGLLERRGGPDQAELLREMDSIVAKMRDTSSKRRDLEEQTASVERERLDRAEEDALRRATTSTSARDQKLYQKQLEVVRRRKEAIGKALSVLERLRVRQDVAEHQVKQLRLDLSRAEASSASVPELSSRLQDIRHEVDATEDVDEELARELTS